MLNFDHCSLLLLPLFLLSLIAPIHGAEYIQTFSQRMPVANASLSDGSRVSGHARIADGVLQLTNATGQRGEFFVPALSGASLGWTCNFSATLVGGNAAAVADGVGVAWGNVSQLGNRNLIQRVDSVASAGSTARFAAWLVDTFQNADAAAGFWLMNSTGARSGMALYPLLPRESINVTVFAAWNPKRGATLLTSGFRANANIVDVPVTLGNASDTYGWWIVAECGGYAQRVTIDELQIVARCNDCLATNGTCEWGAAGRFECSFPLTLPMQTFGGGATTEATTESDAISASTALFNATTASESMFSGATTAPIATSIETNAAGVVLLTSGEIGAILGIVIGIIVLLASVVIVLVLKRRCQDSEPEETVEMETKAMSTRSTTSTTTSIYSSATSRERESTVYESPQSPLD
jgi:hypothetical protein